MANRVAREIISYFIATAGDLIAKYSTRFLTVPSGPTEIGISSVKASKDVSNHLIIPTGTMLSHSPEN